MKAVRKGQMGDFLPACQELMTAKLADESEDILSILLVEIAKCNNRIQEFFNRQSKWNAEEIQCANPPTKIGTNLIDGNRAFRLLKPTEFLQVWT